MNWIKSLVALFAFAFTVSSCSNSSMRVLATWVNKEKTEPMKGKVKSIIIIVFTQNFEAQSALENDLAKVAESRGIKVYKSIDVYGPILTAENRPPKEAFVKSVHDMGCDGIFAVAVVDRESETRYVPETYSTGMYTPYPGYGYNYGGFYAYTTTLYSPGYYTETKTYFLQSNFYDAKTEELLVAMQSKLINPPDMPKASRKYTALLLQELQNQGFLQQKPK
ncbi:MAG: hypothetical protein ACHQET_09950 [Chitinophagales bacterium]